MAKERGYRPRSWVERLSRRRVLTGAALGSAGLAATVIGCGEGKKPAVSPEQPGVKQPKRGGILVHYRREDFDAHFDAHLLNGAFTGMMGLFYQNLVRYHPRTYEIEPELAQRWEQPSPTEFVFHLAPGIRWHNKPPVNGRPFTAEDVVFALERIKTDDPKFINRALLTSAEKIEAINSATVKITMPEPDVTLLINLADLTSRMIAREVVEKFGTGKFATPESAIGTGAFILRDMDEVSATAVRNPDYWKPGLPYLDGVRMVRMADDQARWAAFITGRIDVNGPVPGAEAKRVKAEAGKTYVAEEFKDIAVTKVWLNTRRKPWDDARVVRAFRLLIDHTEFITGWAEVWFGGGTLQGGAHLPRGLEAWDFSEEEYREARDPIFLEFKQPKDEAVKEALALLNAAGFNRSNPIRFEQSSGGSQDWSRAAAELLQAQYHRLSQGVLQAELKFYDNAQHIGMQSRGEFEVAGPQARASHIDPDQMFRQTYHSRGSQNFGRWSDPTADRMIEKQRTLFDIRERRAAVKEIVRYLLQHAPYTGVCSRGVISAAHLKVKNWSPESTARFPGHQYEYIWLDT